MESNQQVRRGYNQISGFYDLLQWIVFGNALRNAEIKSVQLLKNCNTVLVIGGGSGFFLEHLVKLGIPTIIYVELSDKMIGKAKEKVARIRDSASEIIYVNKSWGEYIPDAPVDAIVTNYFLDMFTESTIDSIIQRYIMSLRSGGLWYCTDFYKNDKSILLTRLLLKCMYFFFVAACRIEASKLPSIFSCFKEENFKVCLTEKSAYLRQTLYIKK